MRMLRRVLGLAVFLAVLVAGWKFAAANAARIEVDYLAGRISDLPLWAALVASFLAGAACAGLFGVYEGAKLSLQARRYRKAARGLEAEVHQLRNLPLANEAPADAFAAATGTSSGRGERGNRTAS